MGNVFGCWLRYDVIYVRMVEAGYHALLHYTRQFGEIHDHSVFFRTSLQDNGYSVRMSVQGFAFPMISYEVVRRVKSEFFTK